MLRKLHIRARYLRLQAKFFVGNLRYLSSSQVFSSVWSSLVSNKEIKESTQDYSHVLRLRDALIRSKETKKSVGGGEILPETLASDFGSYYQKVYSKVEKLKVFLTLAQDFGLDHNDITSIAEDINHTKERGINTHLKLEEKLLRSLEPPYLTLLSYIGRQEGGVKFIVDLRKDLLEILSDRELDCPRDELIALNHNIRHLLSMWFSVGFLNIERMTWQSPCDITQKIADYEAVHQVRNWMDIKKRIGPYRRCYVFMHPSMPREPVCVLHIALRDEIASSIQDILTEKIPGDEKDVEKKNTAVFYSVSSTQKGLAEIDLGNSLIKEAVKQLTHDLPNIKTFVTLSPIPGFFKWFEYALMSNSESSVFTKIMDHKTISVNERKFLESYLKKPYNLSFKEVLSDPSWLRNSELCEILKKPLMDICASYLYNEKQRGFAYDPVANFHLRNGAILWRLNWKADVSNKGALSSLGMMVNYKYSLDKVDDNSMRYFLHGDIALSKEFREILPKP